MHALPVSEEFTAEVGKRFTDAPAAGARRHARKPEARRMRLVDRPDKRRIAGRTRRNVRPEDLDVGVFRKVQQVRHERLFSADDAQNKSGWRFGLGGGAGLPAFAISISKSDGCSIALSSSTLAGTSPSHFVQSSSASNAGMRSVIVPITAFAATVTMANVSSGGAFAVDQRSQITAIAVAARPLSV